MASHIFSAATILLVLCLPIYSADTPAIAPNSDPTYQQLRNLTLSGEAVSVTNFTLKRDAGRFNLRSGTLCFVTPVTAGAPSSRPAPYCFQSLSDQFQGRRPRITNQISDRRQPS
jgi:hypothetical protein